MSQETSDGLSNLANASLWTPAPTGNQSDVHCLNCNSPLQFAFLGERELMVKVAWCGSCSGMMVQRAALGKVICDLRSLWTGPEQIPEPVNPDQVPVRRSCPVCLGEMESFLYCGPGNVTLDSCNGCDITWLDGGELNRLIVAPGRRQPWAGTSFDKREVQRELQGMTGNAPSGNPTESFPYRNRERLDLTPILSDLIGRYLS